MKNILHIIDHCEYGGAEKHTFLLCKEFAKRKNKVILACPPGNFLGKFKELENYGVKIIVVDVRKHLLKSFKMLKKNISENSIDVIHSHMYRADFLAALLKITSKRKIIVVTTIHNMLDHDTSGLKKILYTVIAKFSFFFIDRIFTVSAKVNETTRKYFKLNKAKVVTVLNGIENDALVVKSNNLLRKELSIDAGKIIICCTGSLNDRKGQEVLIKAFAPFKKNAVLVLLGVGPSENKLKELALNLDIFDEIFFMGYRNNVLEIVKQCDVYVQPSFWDPLPRAMLEAMGLGIPTIGSNVDGIPEVIMSGETGLLFQPGDVKELSKRLETLISDEELRKRLSKNGRKFIEEHCTIEKMCDKIDEYI
ncbi:glycosyltransferase family 4 protein [Sporolactobacillus terrae]|uniref:Glycosyltransferase family 1 protein n=1 Tax=Sporolactobacillus terrae TaxID=269673 RepID=A0A5K7X1B7_9BACL|nr:glycosyltransferase family 4 protein [Sporolactobacillus terrae]BBN97846.1 hypothetical protein St703_05510 [Sporolactobacillus terrae]